MGSLLNGGGDVVIAGTDKAEVLNGFFVAFTTSHPVPLYLGQGFIEKYQQ